MDCQEVGELLNAYALGAVEKDEAKALEEHVADCLRCWRELTEAQRAVALLALAVPLARARPSLRQRVMAGVRRRERWAGLEERLGGLRRFWPVAVGTLAASTAAALALSLALQNQFNGLEDENDSLQRQVLESSRTLGEQQQLVAMFSAPDYQDVALKSTSAQPQALGTYYWSETTHHGAIVCNNLHTLPPDQAYQLWLFVGDEPFDAGTFTAWNGTGQHTFDFEALGLKQKPTAVGVSIEPAAGSDRPTGDLVLFADFPQD